MLEKLPPLLDPKGDKPESVGAFFRSRRFLMAVTGSELGLQWITLTPFLVSHVEGSLQNLEGQKGYSYPKAGGWQRRNVKGINIYGSLLHPVYFTQAMSCNTCEERIHYLF